VSAAGFPSLVGKRLVEVAVKEMPAAVVSRTLAAG